MPDKTVLLGVIIELGTDIGNGILKRNAGNTEWEQVLPKDILAAASGDVSVNNQKIINLADVTLGSGGNRVIKIADNDNLRSLTIKTGDEVTPSTGSGDLVLDVGAAVTSVGKLTLGAANAAEVNLGRSGGKVGFLGATAVVQAGAYTQTYATAARTQSALTSATLTDSSGGTPGTTLAAITGGGSDCENATKDAIASLGAQINALRADLENVKQVTNALIDDEQGYGLAS
jgi:hypothetical protein